jgi:molecular chaperone GrpE
MNSEDSPPEGGEEGRQIEPSDEMADALREATEAVEARQDRPEAEDSKNLSTDKKMIEMLAQELQALKEQYEKTAAELEQVQDRELRLKAEFENFRRRGLKEKQESLQYGHQNLVKDLLATIDNLERAVTHGRENEDADMASVLEGLELVQRELLGAIGKHGVKVIDPVGQVFDPTFHEAMGQIPDGSVEPNSVLEVLQKGFMLQDRLLRPARVLVAREVEKSE